MNAILKIGIAQWNPNRSRVRQVMLLSWDRFVMP
jgi:hypothetical protein